MDVSIAGLLMVVLWGCALLRGFQWAVFATLLLSPFGTAAVVNLTGVGGLSLLALHVTAFLCMGISILLLVFKRPREPLILSPASIALLLICLYGTITALLMPRLLMNEIEVIIFKKAVAGVRVSEFFYTTLMPLQPQPSNISQTAYLWASFGFFLVVMRIGRQKGPLFLIHALLGAAAINAVLGVLDFLRLDMILQHIRTAGYAINPDWGMHGADRLIGGFSEPSAFGSFCVGFATVSASVFLDRRDRISGVLAAMSIAFAFMALSSTALLGLCVMGALLGSRAIKDFLAGRARRKIVLNAMVAVIALTVLATLTIALTPLSDFLQKVLDSLIFNKSTSASGLERAYWTERGFVAFLDTYGLGAGIGSIRSNGSLPVILGSLGVPGLIGFVLLYWICLFRPLPHVDHRDETVRDALIAFRAAFAAAVVMLAMQFVAATVVDPGILFLSIVAIAYVARRKIVSRVAAVYRPEPPLMGQGANLGVMPPMIRTSS